MNELAFIDLETTGLDPERHEIIEIAVQVIDPANGQLIAAGEAKVRPERIDQADPEALRVAGYDEETWRDAVSLQHALRKLTPLLEGRVVAGHNVGFDWSFLLAAWRRCGLHVPVVHYHRLDTVSLAWPLLSWGQVSSMSLDALCTFFGIERPTPHRAAADVRATVELFRALDARMWRGSCLT